MSLPRPWASKLITLPAFIALAGALLSLGSALQIAQRVEQTASAEFDRMANGVDTDIARRFTLPLYGLRGLLGLFASGSGVVERDRFRAAVDAMALDTEFPGVRGFGFIQSVPAQSEDLFVDAVRADGAPGFGIRSLGPGADADRYVIKYVEPLARNAEALGLDVGSEGNRRAAIERAIASGRPALTDPIVLVQDGRRSPGFLLYLPAYRHGADLGTPVQRRAALLGVLYAPIVAAELLDGAGLAAAGQVDFSLSFGPADLPGPDPVYATVAPAGYVAAFHRTDALEIVGSRFALGVRSTPAFDASVPRSTAWLVLGGGLLLTAFLAYLVHLMAVGRLRAETLAQRMTAELGRLAMVARHTSNAVVITGPDRRITWVNDGFERITGYSLDEVVGMSPGARLQFEGTDPDTLVRMRSALDSRQAFRGEVLNRAKDGRPYWLELEIQPLLDAAGGLTGFMAIESDITDRKDAAAALAAARRETDALLHTIRTHAIVSMADRYGRIIEVNDAFCAICQYSRDELLGQDHRIVNSGAHEPGFWVEMWRTVASGRSWRAEVCNRAKDGSLYWVDSIVAPFVGADGQIEKYVSVRTDITASKRAAQELARERARLALIIDGTNAGTWEIDLETGEDSINEAYARMLGYGVDALQARINGNFLDLLHVDDRDAVARARQVHLEGLSDEYEVEFRMQHRAGHWVWVLSRGRVGLRDPQGRALHMAGIHLDITARKLAEQALRASQALLDTTGRIANVGGWMLDLASNELTWSDQTCRIHDLPPGHKPTLDEAVAFYAPAVRDKIRSLVQRAVDTGAAWDEELPFVSAGGRAIWVRTMGEVEREAGRAVRLVGAFQDITERRALAEELRRGGEVMTSIVENLPCGVSVFNDRLELVASNRKYRELLGFPDAMFASPRPRFEAFIRYNAERGEYGDGDVDQLVRDIVDRAAGPTQPHRFERLRPDGTPIEVQGVPMPGGGFVTTYTDISDRRRAEHEVRRSADLLRGAIEAIDEAFVLYDPDDRLVLCNERYRQTYAGVADLIVPGVSFEELVRAGAYKGDYLDAVGREEEWVRERVAAHRRANSTIVQRLENGKTLRIVERRLPDGHIVGFRIDVTELTQATDAAEQASRAKSQFLANISHEIRTPMNAILGMLRLLRKSGLDASQDDYAAKTEGAARSLLGLLNDILDFSKAEAGKTVLDLHPFRIDRWLEDQSVILTANAEVKGIALRFETDPSLPVALVGDSLRLQQVLLNLVGNAIKFTEHGEVVVRLATTARTADHVDLEVSVQDTGIGIAPENHERIFSGFTQAEASTTRRFGGTGLGVAICQRLVGLMGGELRLDSALGQGSRFWFQIRLPVADEADCELVDPAPAPVRAGTGRLAGLRLLVAEDNANNQQVVRELLEDEGASVHIVDNGQVAVAAVAAATAPYDVVLMDLQMPEMDGYTATSRIRRQLGRRELPIVAMSANAMASDREACLAAGMDEHVGKPFDLDHLVALLLRLTRRSDVPARRGSVETATPALRQPLQDAAAQAGVDLTAALQRMGGRQRAYGRLLDNFVRDLASMPSELHALAAAGRMAELQRHAHTVKGLAATLGAGALATRAADVENALRGAKPATVGALAQSLSDEIETARAALAGLSAALREDADQRAAPLPAAAGDAFGAALQRLSSLLSDCDMDALAAVDNLRQTHAAALGDQLEPLEDAVARLDFECALRTCRALMEGSRA